jgi:NTP pyrophosphatase (non-canonical NTP hydrolase)
MTYYLYHIPGKKIGITKDLKKRVEEQQGYNEGEYDIMLQTDDIVVASELEIQFQKAFGYPVDQVPYNKLKFNKMKINVTEATTTFPCPLNKLKGQLMDNIGMKWDTEHGELNITPNTIKWIMKNAKMSMYNSERCYIYNKAFARYYDNNDAYDQYNGKTKSGGLLNDNKVCGEPQFDLRDCDNCDCEKEKLSRFDLIRMWANQRGLYEKGDAKTQALKLTEEVGETCRAILKNDMPEIVDGIGDCVVVLTNLAEIVGVPIEQCIDNAYNEIANRKGKMVNGTFKKD